MKKFFVFLAGCLLTILFFAGCSKHMVLYSGEIMQKDTIFIVPVPGYSYNVTIEKPETENLTETRATVISTSSGKLVNVPEDGDVSEVIFKDKSLVNPSTSSDAYTVYETDQDTVHIYCNETGEWQFIDCNEGETINVYCGDNVIRMPCRHGTVIEFHD